MYSIYKIFNEGLTSKSETLTPADFTDAGQKGWKLHSYSVAGIDYALLSADADADTFPLHKDGSEWFGYVVEGHGQLYLGNDSNTTETVNYEVGDILHFGPDTYHGWKSQSPSTKLMFVKPRA